MTKAECIHAFFSSFGIPAYEEHCVPEWLDDAQTRENRPPYITYNYALDDFRGDPAAITCDIWDCSETWDFLEETAVTISQEIGRFKRLVCDDGYIIITKGSPFAQPFADTPYKRYYLNLTLTFITN